jgi:hypothetical protein
MRKRRRKATSNGSNSPKEHRREGYLDKAVNSYSAPQHIRRVVLLLPRQRRVVAGNGLDTTIMNLRRKTSGAASQGLGTTIKYLRGAAGIGLGTTIKYLRRATSPV